MEPNWSSISYFPMNDHDISGSMSNVETDSPDVYGMEQVIVPYTQHEPGHAGQALYSTSHYAGQELGMSSMGVYPDIIFPDPGPSVPGGSDYGRFPNSSFPGGNYMEGLESVRNTGMMYGRYQEPGFNAMNLDNNNNSTQHSTILPPMGSLFNNSNAHAIHGMHFSIPVDTPIYGHAHVHAQAPDFGLGLNLDLGRAPTIPTSTMQSNIPLLTPAVPPLTPTGPIITTTTPTTVIDDDHSYGHHYHAESYSNHATPASDLSEQETSANASKGGNRKGNGERIYRVSYDHHASRRYTCHPCRFSTDVKRDFDRHGKTKKHRKRQSQQQGQQGEEQ
ncbi:hypothetical protein QBC32DRAFT_337983 [Pseudoneurospora amorphoporcata]|uniref:Uncharacterized protein n=1 Tax=Pseudoneurospora amorphoporcata TaxID=241081 RepID=A0AAN6NZ89_9PEZI|nr:hypothetical protein QBC32DRAFT_337983 [Pseudoneurospora amorphoporcata]